jgi:geranylgeranyl reductase family protein
VWQRERVPSDLWDVVVVGAGPAGAAAALGALRARPDARVLLLDRATFPRDKACGDGVAPHALDELARLGVADVLGDRVPVRRLVLQAPNGAEVAHDMARPAYVVPREVFDARLVQRAVAAGAVLRQQTVRTVGVRPDGAQVDDERARVVVAADGANGVVRRQLGLSRQPDTALALAVRGYAPSRESGPDRVPEQRIVMAGGGSPAYAWSFDAGDGTANVGFGMLLPRLQEAGSHSKELLEARLRELLPGVEPTRLRSHHLPLSSFRPQPEHGPVLLTGDALSLINPLTGEGIFYALLSGRLAGIAAVTGTSYADALRAELGRHLRQTGWLHRLAQHRRALDAGVRAARAPEVFDALVEVGLGRGLITAPLARATVQQLLRGGRHR